MLHRVHLEGWDLAAACVQQHMSAVGIGLGPARNDGREQGPDMAGADADAGSPRDNVTGRGHAATEQRLMQLDAPQMRLVIVANELSREGGYIQYGNVRVPALLSIRNMLAAASHQYSCHTISPLQDTQC